MQFDIAVVGGGIVGLASAHSLLDLQPDLRLVLIEKEEGPARHQSGHNSGVIHSGIYYTPGSLKADLCRRGSLSMAQFCRRHGIRHDVCGKVIVATEHEELPRLEALNARGVQNGVPVNRLTAEQLREREPHVAGLAALEAPTAGIADYPAVAARLAELIQTAGGEIRYGCRLTGCRTSEAGLELVTSTGTIGAKRLITCAGLQSDLVARMCGASPNARIVPFRGEYYTLKQHARHLVNHLVYPLPNPTFPFLGVHFTRMVNGEMHAGPNAVVAFKREGYSNRQFSLGDVASMLAYRGFRRLAARHWRSGLSEMRRSFSRKAFLTSLQKLVPEIRNEDIEPSPAGVRAMALLPDGEMVDDFLIVPGPHALHVCNAPSPAATASLEIGKYVAGLAADLLRGS